MNNEGEGGLIGRFSILANVEGFCALKGSLSLFSVSYSHIWERPSTWPLTRSQRFLSCGVGHFHWELCFLSVSNRHGDRKRCWNRGTTLGGNQLGYCPHDQVIEIKIIMGKIGVEALQGPVARTKMGFGCFFKVSTPNYLGGMHFGSIELLGIDSFPYHFTNLLMLSSFFSGFEWNTDVLSRTEVVFSFPLWTWLVQR